jgi:hypothetical protein
MLLAKSSLSPLWKRRGPKCPLSQSLKLVLSLSKEGPHGAAGGFCGARVRGKTFACGKREMFLLVYFFSPAGAGIAGVAAAAGAAGVGAAEGSAGGVVATGASAAGDVGTGVVATVTPLVGPVFAGVSVPVVAAVGALLSPCGVAGGCSGVVGVVSSSKILLVPCFVLPIVRLKEVNMKTMAVAEVSLVRKLPAPELPKIV